MGRTLGLEPTRTHQSRFVELMAMRIRAGCSREGTPNNALQLTRQHFGWLSVFLRFRLYFA